MPSGALGAVVVQVDRHPPVLSPLTVMAVGLVVLLALLVALGRSERVARPLLWLGAAGTALVAVYGLGAPLLGALGVPLAVGGDGSEAYFVNLRVRAVGVGVLWAVFWWRRTYRALQVAGLLTLLMGLPELLVVVQALGG